MYSYFNTERMKNEEQLALVTFEQAKKLKMAGFNWMCGKRYISGYLFDGEVHQDDPDNICPAPTVALALKWLRDVKRLKSTIVFHFDHTVANPLGYYKYGASTGWGEGIGNFDTYEDAESALLDKLLTNL
jgi:hypothetical protein